MDSTDVEVLRTALAWQAAGQRVALVTVVATWGSAPRPSGSRASNAKRRARLRQLERSEAHIARLHGPVGLRIGSRTPPEIAVSILAHLVAVKNNDTVNAALAVAEHEGCTA